MSPIKLNGSTSGFVALDAPAAAGSNTLVLPTGNGSNGQVLTTNGSGALSWGAGSKILQVVQGSTTTEVTYTSSVTWTSSGLSASITPSSTSNKILILVSAEMNFYRSGSGGVGSGLKIERSGTAIVTTPNDYGLYIEAAASAAPSVQNGQRISLNYLDSPSSTSSLTYTLYGKNYSGGSSSFQAGTNPSYMILMEVAA